MGETAKQGEKAKQANQLRKKENIQFDREGGGG